MTTRACTTYMVHSVKATGLGDGAPEDQRGKHRDQRQAAAKDWGRRHLWRVGVLERGLMKGDRRGTGSQGWWGVASQGWWGVASSCRKATESGRGVVTITTTGLGKSYGMSVAILPGTAV